MDSFHIGLYEIMRKKRFFLLLDFLKGSFELLQKTRNLISFEVSIAFILLSGEC